MPISVGQSVRQNLRIANQIVHTIIKTKTSDDTFSISMCGDCGHSKVSKEYCGKVLNNVSNHLKYITPSKIIKLPI